MNRKLVLALVLTLLIGMLNVAFNVQRAKASGIIYIRADGSIDPPDAPISTVDNVTYTLTGNITSDGDGIVVERDNIVIDGADYTVQGTSRGTGTGIDLSVRINVTVRNIEITAFDCGIYLYDSSNNTIIRNNITNTNEGISLAGSSNNFIAENNITNNSYGIWLDYSLNNSMSGNNITNNYDGITLYHSSSNNVISENNITNNSDGNHLSDSSNNTVSSNTFLNDGLFVWSSYGNAVEDNIVNGKPLVYLEGVSNQTIENAGQVILVNCNNITVQNLNLFNTNTAIELWQTQKAKITNNSITNNCYGIYLQYSLNNNIYGNNVTDNQPYATGINLVHSSNNNIYGNNIRNNSWGVYLYNCSNNNIFGNSITDNGGSEVFGYGVCLAESSNNSICENNIRNNTYRGICLWQDSSNNTIYHNEFINNTSHVDLDVWTEVINIWDDGYPSGGNYWSDYTGVDVKSGPGQDLSGSDGIGDAPLIIDANNTDGYPLTAPISVFDAGVWNGEAYNVNVISNSTVSDFHFNPDEGPFLRFNVTGPENTTGFCRVTIPKSLLWTDSGWTINVNNDTITKYGEFSDDNNTYLYFTYNQTTKTVEIHGSHVIPEFPSALILPFLMILTMLAVVFAKRKIPRRGEGR